MLVWDAQKQLAGVGIVTLDVMVTKSFKQKRGREERYQKENPYYKSLSKEKFMKRNALNRNRRGRK